MALVQVVAGNRVLASDLNQFYNILKGVAASGESVTLIYNNEALIFQPSSDPTAGTRVWTVKNNAGTVLASMRYDGLLKLLSAAADPATAVSGSIYFDTNTNTLKFNDGTNWQFVGEQRVNRYPWYWTPGMAVESTLTGTGSYTVPSGFSHGQLSTGATSGSNVGLRLSTTVFASGSSGSFELRSWALTLATDKAASEAWRIFVTDESVTGQPSLTARHLGVRSDGTTISFSTADGATEQTTDVTAQFTANTTAHLVITFDGTTALLYIDGTLRATHATNVPTSTAAIPIFRAHITNSTAADKILYLVSNEIKGLA